MENEYYFNTLAIHGGEEEENPRHALNHPIFMTSTFTFNDLQHAEKTFSFETDDYVYTRGNNPTLRLLEKKMAVLEEGVDSVAFASGMAAITTTLYSLLKPGDKLIAHQVLYGSAYNVVKKVLPQYGIETKLLDLTDPAILQKELDEKTKVIYFESPANPTLEIIDIGKIRKIAGPEIKIVVDNTFATPFLQKPLKMGADVVVHSATKYISGHGDVVAGIAVANDQNYIHSLKFDYMTEFGGVMSPFNAWLLLRGLKTLGIRMREHCQNAVQIANFLEQHPRINKVYYPGLPGFKYHQLASEQMSGYGAIISFEIEGGYQVIEKMIKSLDLIKLAVSLGDTETLIEYPFAMTHRGYTKEVLDKMGLNEQLIRLAVGLEDYRNITADLEQALS